MEFQKKPGVYAASGRIPCVTLAPGMARPSRGHGSKYFHCSAAHRTPYSGVIWARHTARRRAGSLSNHRGHPEYHRKY